MRVVCPYRPTVHYLTRDSLTAHAPWVEYLQVSDSPEGYWTILAGLWAAAETFTVIEHDVELHSEVIPGFIECPELWCVFPYLGPPGSKLTFDSALGCVRFRRELMIEHPDALPGMMHLQAPHRDWRRLDSSIAHELRQRGYTAHVHEPAVRHHHEYPQGCACGEEH